MLEVVGVEFAAVQGNVGLYIVSVLDDLHFIALGLEKRLGGTQNFRMRRRRSANFDDLRGGSGVRAADGQSQSHESRYNGRTKRFHAVNLGIQFVNRPNQAIRKRRTGRAASCGACRGKPT